MGKKAFDYETDRRGPERAQRTRDSRGFNALSDLRRTVKMEKSANLSRAWCIPFNGRQMARRPGQNPARFDARDPAVLAGLGVTVPTGKDQRGTGQISRI